MARNLKLLARNMNDAAWLKMKPVTYAVNKHKGKDRIFKFKKGKVPKLIKIL